MKVRNNKLKVLFVTLDKCPNLDAGAVRAHSFASIFVAKNAKVTVLSMGPRTNGKPIYVDGVQYISLRLPGKRFFCRALSYVLFPIRVAYNLLKTKADLILHSQVDEITLKLLSLYGKLEHIQIVYDAVEWFSPEQFKKGTRSRAYKLNDNYNSKWIVKPHKVISISSYLYANFERRNVETIKVPVIMDTDSIDYSKTASDNIIRILYAGSPGKKDYINIVVEAFMRIIETRINNMELTILGCTLEQFAENYHYDMNTLRSLSSRLLFKGRVSRNEVLAEYKRADFSILIRPENARFAKAGFPTKLVESLATGTPVICNITSDIGDYIRNNENGVIVNGEDVTSCYDAFRNISEMDKSKLAIMKKKARLTAETYFDYKKYATSVLKFVER